MILAPLLTFCLAVLLLAAGSPPLQAQDSTPRDQIYYFPHLAVGASWQTTITYINYSPQEVTCQTDFLSDDGTPLMVSFEDRGTVPSRTDVLPPGGSVHQETNVELSAPLAPGWARATCSGPVQASLLYRLHNSEGAPTAEAGVNATAVPATRFVTFAEQGEDQFGTGVAYANPSAISVPVTFTARDGVGEVLAEVVRTLSPGGHDAHGMAELFGLTSFTGSLEVTSTEPIVSLSLNFEAAPVFSSLPPGELDASAQGSTTYYFPHLAVGASWQTTITYINFSREEVTCQTEFISDHGTPLMVSFAALGTVVSRTDVLPPGGSVHQETNVDLNASLAPGWARATCSGPVQASLLYRLHNSEGAPTAEAGVNATAVPATRFVTFAEQGEDQFGTGVAYANPSAISVPVTFTARDGVGEVLAEVVRTLSPGGHDAHGMAELFGLTSFTGSLEVTSTEPIVSLSLNFEAAPVFSSLPPGETPGGMLAPTDEAAFNDLFVGKRATTNLPAVYVDFVSPGRFRETRFAVTLTGSYTYRNTGSDAGTLTFNYDDGDRCTAHLTFVSTTAGTATYTCNDGSSGGYNWLLVAISATGTPDLVVQTPSVSDSSPNAGGAFTLSATVRNQGNGLSASTTLRYYRSPDATISTSDTAVGTDAVGGLAASGTSAESISLTAPSTAGTYYYGACVDPVSGESATGNNCSSAVRVTVRADSDGDGIPDVSDPDDDNDGVPDTDDPCPLDGRDTCDDTTSVVSLEISGTMPLTSIGQTIQLAATTHMLDGSSQAIASAFVHWVSSDPAVATVIDGTVTAVGPGNASTVATYQGQKAVAEISVHISAREMGTVRVIYAAPSDRKFRSDYRDAIQHAIVDLQSWYRRQLGGLTFSLYDATPELCQLSETSDYYDQDPWQKVLEGVQHCAPVEDNTSTFAWVIYADLEAVCGARSLLGLGGPGITMVGREDLEGLIGNRLVYYDACGRGPYAGPVIRWIGGIGHELGHALGLSHPPGCDDGLPTCDRAALMHFGYTTYPDTYLRPDDKQVLWRSPFIEKNPSQRQLMEEAGIVAAIRGTVSDPGGEVVVGIRVLAVSDDFWAWGETASDGIFEIRLPDGSSGSSVLSVHAGGVADCGWLGYHVAGGLTTFREHATRIELGEVDPAIIEISLPAISGELCQGQRTVSGTVLGPSGDPVGVFVGAFDQRSFSGDDGLFELRLPEGSGGSSPLLVEVPECGHVGFYGPGGFTTRFADAWQWEIGAVNVAGIVIRLPATPEELCRRQPTIAGTVVGPDGEVMEGIWVGALQFRRWGMSGADGTFEIRLLEGTTGMPVLGIYADCGPVGYYGPNGFTTSREDATGIEIGEGNVTGIVIRLPAEPDELCGKL